MLGEDGEVHLLLGASKGERELARVASAVALEEVEEGQDPLDGHAAEGRLPRDAEQSGRSRGRVDLLREFLEQVDELSLVELSPLQPAAHGGELAIEDGAQHSVGADLGESGRGWCCFSRVFERPRELAVLARAYFLGDAAGCEPELTVAGREALREPCAEALERRGIGEARFAATEARVALREPALAALFPVVAFPLEVQLVASGCVEDEKVDSRRAQLLDAVRARNAHGSKAPLQVARRARLAPEDRRELLRGRSLECQTQEQRGQHLA
jgi:hypothetical protein